MSAHVWLNLLNMIGRDHIQGLSSILSLFVMRYRSWEPHIDLSWSTLDISMRLAPSNMFNPLFYFTDRSKAAHLSFCGPFCYVCNMPVMLSCLFLAALLLPAEKDWPLGSLVCDVFLWFVTFSYVVLGQGPISSIKFVRYILNCAYVVFWEVRTSVSSKHLKLFVRTKLGITKNVVFLTLPNSSLQISCDWSRANFI